MTGSILASERGRRAAPGRPGWALRRARGGISWVTLLLLALVAGGGYWLWVWAPVYFESYAVRQVVQDFMNQAVKDPDDASLRRNMVLRIRALGEREGVDAWGRPARVPWVPLEERDVTWERDTRSQPPMLRVAFEYAREVEYPGLHRSTTKVFAVDLTSDLAPASWAPPR